MTIEFNQIPNNLLIPIVSFEFNAAGSVFSSESKCVIIGQKLSGGSAANDVVIPVPDNAEDALFGRGSMLAAMLKIAKRNSPTTTFYALPLADPSGSTATATITASGTASVNETVILEIHGIQVNVEVLSGDTANEVATAIAAAVNANLDLHCTASATNAVVTLTARQHGDQFNGMRVRVLQADMSVTPTDFGSGSGTVSLTGKLDAIPEGQQYDWIVSPFNDAAALAVYSAYTNDTSGTWSPLEADYGHVTTFKVDTLGNLQTLGNTLNDRHMTLCGNKNSLTPAFYVSAALGAIQVKHLSSPPELSRPLQYLTLLGVKFESTFTDTEANTLLLDEVGVFGINRDGSVFIKRLMTTYKQNQAGSPDSTYSDIQVMAQLMYATRYLKQRLQNRFSRVTLTDARLREVSDEYIHVTRELETLEVIESGNEIIERTVIERNTQNPSMVDVLWPIDHVQGLRQIRNNVRSYKEF